MRFLIGMGCGIESNGLVPFGRTKRLSAETTRFYGGPAVILSIPLTDLFCQCMLTITFLHFVLL